VRKRQRYVKSVPVLRSAPRLPCKLGRLLSCLGAFASLAKAPIARGSLWMCGQRCALPTHPQSNYKQTAVKLYNSETVTQDRAAWPHPPSKVEAPRHLFTLFRQTYPDSRSRSHHYQVIVRANHTAPRRRITLKLDMSEKVIDGRGIMDNVSTSASAVPMMPAPAR
jgi:hypothetical protein